MRTAKNNAVSTGGNQRFDPTPYRILRLRPRNDATLNQIHKLVRDALYDPDSVRHLRRGFTVQPSIERTACRKHSNDTAFGFKRGRLHRRLHPYERNLRPLVSQLVYRSGSRRVARHHNNLTPSAYEIGGNPFREPHYLLWRLVPVRTVLTVGDIYGRFIRTKAAKCFKHTSAANSTVEKAHHRLMRRSVA